MLRKTYTSWMLSVQMQTSFSHQTHPRIFSWYTVGQEQVYQGRNIGSLRLLVPQRVEDYESQFMPG